MADLDEERNSGPKSVLFSVPSFEDQAKQRVEAEIAVSVCDFKKNLSAIIDGAHGNVVAIPIYVSAGTYEAMIDTLEDQTLDHEGAYRREGRAGQP